MTARTLEDRLKTAMRDGDRLDRKRGKMPVQKPGKSKQTYATPSDFFAAVTARFGIFSWDLAASAENTKAQRYITEAQDSLGVAWHKLDGLLWLNPPFSNIEAWAKKWKQEAALGARGVMLTPASVGSNWFAESCHFECHVVFIRPRLTFEGEKDPYPKDCMLTLWHPPIAGHGFGGYSLWDWRKDTKRDDRFARAR